MMKYRGGNDSVWVFSVHLHHFRIVKLNSNECILEYNRNAINVINTLTDYNLDMDWVQ